MKENIRVRWIHITGPSGVGKDTVVKEMETRLGERFQRVITYTTRLPRKGEVEGIDYHFVSLEKFSAMKENGELYECMEYRPGEWKGTSYESLRPRTEEKVVVWRVDPSRAAIEAEMNAGDSSIVTVYIGVRRLSHLIMRKITRETEEGRESDHNKIKEGVRNDWKVWKANEKIFTSHAHVVYNEPDKLVETVDEIMRILGS